MAPTRRQVNSLDLASGNPLFFKPVVRAFALGYLTSTGPRLLACTRLLRDGSLTAREKRRRVFRVARRGLRWDRFPAFCALLTAGLSVAPAVLDQLGLKSGIRGDGRRARIAKAFLLALMIAWATFPLLNRQGQGLEKVNAEATSAPHESANTSAASTTQASIYSRPSGEVRDKIAYAAAKGADPARLAGRTLDLSLFVTARALDVLACVVWTRWLRPKGTSVNTGGRLARLKLEIPGLYDGAVFALTSATVMWAWFYLPDRLPSWYQRWITSAAQIDVRLIEALRQARRGDWVYGQPRQRKPFLRPLEKDPKENPGNEQSIIVAAKEGEGERDSVIAEGAPTVLQTLARDLGLPPESGDPTVTVPFRCEIVHLNKTCSCELHALWRFAIAFRFAMATYLPLQLALRLRHGWPVLRSRPIFSRSAVATLRPILTSALIDASRSSTFLGLFISLFYYAVCLARTRAGPRLIPATTITPMMWDSGLCVAAGCAACGWSVLAEKPRKRVELALFVAPKAMATILPRWYDVQFLWRERAVFSLSVAVIYTALVNEPKMVRGMFGRLLTGVFP